MTIVWHKGVALEIGPGDEGGCWWKGEKGILGEGLGGGGLRTRVWGRQWVGFMEMET